MLPLREIRCEFPEPRPCLYPWNLPAFGDLDKLAFPTPVTFLIGDNGSGKSTFLESVAQAAGLNPQGGSHHASYTATHTDTQLSKRLRLVWNRQALSGFFF